MPPARETLTPVSSHPAEIAAMALTEALFPQRYGKLADDRRAA
jgi:hypothetical protein